MFIYPERKKYRYVIESDLGYVVINVSQATAQETIDFSEMVKSQNIWKIKEYWEEKISKAKYFTGSGILGWYKKLRLKKFLRKRIFDYAEEISTFIHQNRESKYKDEHEPKPKGSRKQLFQNSLFILSEMTKIPVDEVYERLTFEQVSWLMDKAKHDYFDTFEDGQAINLSVKTKMGLSEEQKDLLSYIKANKIDGNGINNKGDDKGGSR